MRVTTFLSYFVRRHILERAHQLLYLRDDQRRDGHQLSDTFRLLFMIPFVLDWHRDHRSRLLYPSPRLFNPTAELALSTGAVQRGGGVDVAWQLAGRTSSIQVAEGFY